MKWRVELAKADRAEGITHALVNQHGRTVLRVYGGLREDDGVAILEALNALAGSLPAPQSAAEVTP